MLQSLGNSQKECERHVISDSISNSNQQRYHENLDKDPLLIYSGTVENLTSARNAYKKSILKYYSKLYMIEMLKIKNTKCCTNLIVPEVKFDCESNASNKTTKKLLLNSAQHSKNTLMECKKFQEEISHLKEIIKKIEICW